MKNVGISIDENNIMNIRVDLNQKHGKSQSGKTDVVATTDGTARFGNNLVRLGVWSK